MEPISGGMTQYNCSLGNPFSAPYPGSLELRVRLNPLNIVGNEPNTLINFTVSSLNPENATTIVDNSNFAEVQINFVARANITIDNGYVS